MCRNVTQVARLDPPDRKPVAVDDDSNLDITVDLNAKPSQPADEVRTCLEGALQDAINHRLCFGLNSSVAMVLCYSVVCGWTCIVGIGLALSVSLYPSLSLYTYICIYINI